MNEMQQRFEKARKSFTDAQDELSHAMALCLTQAREMDRHSQPDDSLSPRRVALIQLGNWAAEIWQGAAHMDFFWTPGAAANWKPVIQSGQGIGGADKKLRACLRRAQVLDQGDIAIQRVLDHLRSAKEHFEGAVKAIRAMIDANNGDDE